MSGIDRSSLVAWASFGLGFAATLALAPEAADDMAGLGPGALAILGAVAAFFAFTIGAQRYMGLRLSDTTFGTPRRLVTTGVFAWSRNPIYVAFLLPLLALAAYSAVAAGVAATAYVVAMNRLVIAREERVLDRMFGADFLAYRRATPRWLIGRG